jgi:hypothetical protein
MGALLLVFRWARGADVDPAKTTLSEVNKDLLRRFQAAVVEAYVARLGVGASAQDQRVARDRALRSSRSLYNQAKSLFNRDTNTTSPFVSRPSNPASRGSPGHAGIGRWPCHGPAKLREQPDGGLLDKLVFGVGVGHESLM